MFFAKIFYRVARFINGPHIVNLMVSIEGRGWLLRGCWLLAKDVLKMNWVLLGWSQANKMAGLIFQKKLHAIA